MAGLIKKFKHPVAWGILVLGLVVGVLGVVGFNAALEHTNTEEFCISCHTMKDHAYADYRNSTHAVNASGVRASCPDCHVPKSFGPKMMAKLRASNDLLGEILGRIDTPEKYEAHRLEMAQRVWARMKETDSRECRSCHKNQAFDFMSQGSRASQRHQDAEAAGQTCIDCHKGITHTLPPIAQGMVPNQGDAVAPEMFRPVNIAPP